MRTEIESWFTLEIVRSNPEKIFVFGDNLIQKGKAGQAIIRDEPNTFGIPTKRLPSMGAQAFLQDNSEDKEKVLSRIRELYRIGREKTLVFPADGLGVGLAKMQDKAPMLFREMNQIFVVHFGVESYRKFL